MAAANFIEPPQCYHDFGHWLSGFTDGEGSFTCHLRTYQDCSTLVPQTDFQICLRADDLQILEGIRAYLGCGNISFRNVPKKRLSTNTKPTVQYRVKRLPDLMDYVIPHFETYPLRAKKARDFETWKQMVALCYKVSLRRLGNPGHPGRRSGWRDCERDEFRTMMNKLRSERGYEFDPSVMCETVHKDQPFLF